MRTAALLLASIGAVLAGPPSAYAGWQYAEWGMKPAEVVEASNGEAWEQYGDGYAGCQQLVQSEYGADAQVFDVRFCFDPDERLVLVRLEPVHVRSEQEAITAYGVLKDRLTAAYGESHSGVGVDKLARMLGAGAEKMWRDVANDAQIRLRRVGDLVALEYRPLKSGL